ncbi:MAG: hypothetical protein CMF25_00075 [Kangiellaceae bacterium]|nr:hypothetical protein [Kangiellaceae bacterium]|tara:strand:- start:93 stop:1412 length:1320 start_codon:yes stop_codon:yes gene_type:complete
MLLSRVKINLILIITIFAASQQVQAETLPPRDECKTNLIIWHPYEGKKGKIFLELIKKYHEKYPHTCITSDYVNWYDMGRKVTNNVYRSNKLDIFIDVSYMAPLNTEIVSPLDVESLKASKQQTLSPIASCALTVNDVLYGIPLEIETTAAIFNRDYLQDAPQTLDELINNAESFSLNSEERFGLSYEYKSPYHHSIIMNGYTAERFNYQKEEWDIANELVAKSYQNVLNWRDKTKILSPVSSRENTVNLFNDGKSLFAFISPAQVFNSNSNTQLLSDKVNYDFFRYPYLNASKQTKLTPWSIITGIFIAQSVQDYKAALKFSIWLSSEDAQKSFFEIPTYVSANDSIYSKDIIPLNKWQDGFYRQSRHSIPYPNQFGDSEYITAFYYANEAIFDKKGDIMKNLNIFEDAMNKENWSHKIENTRCNYSVQASTDNGTSL